MGELVIGTRRAAGRARSVVTLLGLASVAGLVTVLIYRGMVSYPQPETTAQRRPLSFEDDALTTAGGRLEYVGRVPVVTLSGSPAQTGFAHGRLLAKGVQRYIEHGQTIIESSVPRDGWLRSAFADQRLRWRYRLLDDAIPGHHLVELAAIAKGARLDDRYESLVRAQAADDLGTALPSSTGFDLQLVNRSLSAVSPLRDAAGERLAVTRLWARTGGPGDGPPTFVFVIHGDGVVPYLSVGPPGQLGVTTGVNAAGLAIMVHNARTSDVHASDRGIPAAMIARSVLETADNLDDAIKALSSANILGAASFLVVDGKSRRHAVIERSPRHSHTDVSRTVVDGILLGKPFVDDPENDRARRADLTDRRRLRAQELARRATDNGVAALAALLRDRRGENQTQLPPGHRATIDDPLADVSAILDPSAMVLWVGEGPGTSGPMRAIDVRYRLGVSRHPAPPADMPAGSQEDSSGTWQVLEARRDLERALAAAKRGDKRKASERAEAAVTRAPTWPLARRVAGQLAERAGDDRRAFAHYQAYMASPDSARAVEQIQAIIGSH